MAWDGGLVRALTKDRGKRTVRRDESSLVSVERQAEMGSTPRSVGDGEGGVGVGEEVEGGDRGEGSSRTTSARLQLPERLSTPDLQVAAAAPSTSGQSSSLSQTKLPSVSTDGTDASLSTDT